MLVDNLSVHYTDVVTSEAKRRKIELIYNGTYSSEFNPIERLWAWSKQRFTKRCIDGGPYHLQHRMRELVEEHITFDFSKGMSKRIQTCLQMMRDYLAENETV